MNRIVDFIKVFRMYRKFGNGAKHSAKAAYYIAIQRLPF